jgi:hypothetical protein
MAVTYVNRLLVLGTPGRVVEFRDTMRRTLDRKVGDQAWQEEVPFSLETAARITRIRHPEEYAYEPYRMSVWPMRRLSPRRVEVRYQFETRDLEISDLVARLSRRFPAVTLRLAILCLDGDSPYSSQMRGGRVRHGVLSDTIREKHWNAARKKFKLPEDAVYEDDDASEFAERRMFDAVLGYWDKPAPRRRTWSNQPFIRSLADERAFAMIEFAEALKAEEAKQSRPRGEIKAARRGKSQSAAQPISPQPLVRHT